MEIPKPQPRAGFLVNVEGMAVDETSECSVEEVGTCERTEKNACLRSCVRPSIISHSDSSFCTHSSETSSNNIHSSFPVNSSFKEVLDITYNVNGYRTVNVERKSEHKFENSRFESGKNSVRVQQSQMRRTVKISDRVPIFHYESEKEQQSDETNTSILDVLRGNKSWPFKRSNSNDSPLLPSALTSSMLQPNCEVSASFDQKIREETLGFTNNKETRSISVISSEMCSSHKHITGSGGVSSSGSTVTSYRSQSSANELRTESCIKPTNYNVQTNSMLPMSPNSSLGINSSSASVGQGTTASGIASIPFVPNSKYNDPHVLMMVYGSAAQCKKVGGCGLRWVPRSQVPPVNAASQDMQMDKDGTLEISFDEWRDYLLFHPSANLRDIILYWRHATNLDVGEDLSIPDDFSAEEWVSGKWWRHLVAGGVAGMVSRTCTAPLDRLKVFLQVHGSHKFKSLRQCIKYMIDEGGIKSLWRGNGINVIKIAPESAFKFAAYEQAKSVIMKNFGAADRELSIYERFAAGSFAGGFSQSVIYPMEVLKTRLALRKSGQYTGIFDAAKQIYRTEGPRSFYRGYVPNLLGIIPYAGIDLAVYETLKKRYAQLSPGQKDPSVFVIIGCGALSSTCGQLASYPLALIRTRLQAQVLSKDATVRPDVPTTSLGIFKQIIQKEGPMGLYRGITPNFMKVAPAVSISYVVYEKSREALGVRMT
ncbi:uncharacterized protein LOC108678173 isoform X1 [Hyalella azteca]|uniref:Uncharacterized protein LOC108678173 isoform X1 n=1 Tax=Hyalella azteca TaxID=294128 RepID=A0A8B7P875_HYAAZ|nr:uncharacterized protein LOC108678173 isoform X1 [Hyalella azteca]